MNEALQLALAKILQSSMDAVTAGVSFLQAELPEVIRQLLLWKMALSMIFFLLSVIGLIVAVWGVVKLVRWGLDDGCGGEVFATFPGLAAIGCAFAAVSNLTWLQIMIAPKIYLIEYAASLVK